MTTEKTSLLEIINSLVPRTTPSYFNRRTYGLQTKDSVTLFHDEHTSWHTIASEFAKAYKETDIPIMMLDFAVLFKKWSEWNRLMPHITPHYAIKSNDHKALVIFLSALGVNFDCASKVEIDTALSLPGVTGDDIIYGNPCKSRTHLLHARSMNVKRMTFDCVSELEKIKMVFPEAEIILRLKVDDSGASSQLGKKFGAEYSDCDDLFRTVKDLGLNLIGVSFHVGSGQKDASAHIKALRLTRELFDRAKEVYGIDMKFLDIGGGFPGYDDDKSYIRFERIANGITECLDELFPDIIVVAEPGRYFACACFCLLTKVTTKKCIKTEDGPIFKYYLTEGVYGAFNNVLNDKAIPEPQYIDGKYLVPDLPYYPSVVYGPTCDSLDTVLSQVMMHELEVEDFLYWENMGAYTVSVSSTFNGFPLADVVYVWTGLIPQVNNNENSQ